MTPKFLTERLNWRYAVKRFDPEKKLDNEQWRALEQALILTPSSYGLQPWRFLVVQDRETRKQLRSASWNQSQVEDCSHYVVFCARERVDESWIDRHLKRMIEVRNVAPESLSRLRQTIVNDVLHGERGRIAKEWAIRQIYIALGNLITSAAVLGIDTCPMEGLDPQEYDRILDLHGSGFSTILACAVGYRSETDKFSHMKKVRFPTNEVIEYI